MSETYTVTPRLDAMIIEKVRAFEAIKAQIAALSQQIEEASQKQRILYNQGLELKGAIDALSLVKDEPVAAGSPVLETAEQVADSVVEE